MRAWIFAPAPRLPRRPTRAHMDIIPRAERHGPMLPALLSFPLFHVPAPVLAGGVVVLTALLGVLEIRSRRRGAQDHPGPASEASPGGES